MIKHYYFKNYIYIYIYIQFVDGVRVVGIPRHIQTNFFKLVTLFQRILKSATNRHKYGNILPFGKIIVIFW
jgi:hypothetical protein